MLAIEKIIASFLSFPGIFILLWGFITLYIFKKDNNFIIKIISFITIIMMFVTFTGLGVKLITLPLENSYNPPESFQEKIPAVVLGGGVHYLSNNRAVLSSTSLYRSIKAYEIYQELNVPLVFTGGTSIDQDGPGEATVAAEWFRKMGVPENSLFTELKARTTYENAYYIKEWLKENRFKKIYLVTSAVHMKRSAAAFKKQGIDFIPVPTGYLYNQRMGWLDYLPNRGALTTNLMAVHEWIGLLWYNITGRI